MSPSDGLRRMVDVVAASVGLIVGAPILVGLGWCTRVTMGGPVLFRQRRLGRAGRPFDMFKFRTMAHPVPGREAPEFDAERVTGVGRFMRSTSLDELPSLWNLLKGDITLVGPRPLPTHYWQRFRADEYERFEVKPGITGLAQVTGRNLVDWSDRLAVDVRYVRSRSVIGDLRILLKTVPTVLKRSGVAADGAATMYELPADRPG